MHSQQTTTTINVQSRAPGGEWQVRNAFIAENKLVRAGSMPKATLLALANKTMQAWRSYEDGRQLRVYNSDDVRQQEPEPKPRSLGAAATGAARSYTYVPADLPAARSPPQRHLASARACLLGARERLATFRRLGDLNSIDRELHANAVQDLFYALDLVWAAQMAVAQ